MAQTTYTAAVLTKASRALLLSLLPAEHPSVRADHVTLNREPSSEELSSFEEGSVVKFQVTGHVSGSGVQVAAVRGLRVSTGQPAHITVSLAAGRRAVEAGPVLASARPKMVKAFVLEAVLKVFEH